MVESAWSVEGGEEEESRERERELTSLSFAHHASPDKEENREDTVSPMTRKKEGKWVLKEVRRVGSGERMEVVERTRRINRFPCLHWLESQHLLLLALDTHLPQDKESFQTPFQDALATSLVQLQRSPLLRTFLSPRSTRSKDDFLPWARADHLVLLLSLVLSLILPDRYVGLLPPFTTTVSLSSSTYVIGLLFPYFNLPTSLRLTLVSRLELTPPPRLFPPSSVYRHS